MGTGGSPTQSRDRNTRQVPDIRTNEGMQNFDPVGWQRALQTLQALQEQDNNPQYNMEAVNDFQKYLPQVNDYQQQTPQTFGQSVINFNQLARQQTPQYQAPQEYVRSGIDLNQLIGQQGYNTLAQPTYRQQSYNAPQQNYPVRQSSQRYEAPQQPVTQPIQPSRQAPMNMNNANFDNVIQLILKNEGGYTRFSQKLGGETNFGIIENTFKNAKSRGYIKSPDVRRLTRDDAIKIYRTDFWKQSRADQMPNTLAGIYFDAYIQRPTVVLALKLSTL